MKSFTPLPNPGPRDWLASQDEKGQTVSDFDIETRCPTPSQGTIYIQPLDSRIDAEMIDFLQAFATAFHPATIAVLPALELETSRAASGINGYRECNSEEIVTSLKSQMPSDAICLVGITMEDLYTRDDWNFVFGLASLTAGVFSFCDI